jgi:ferredoxin-NADP reductase
MNPGAEEQFDDRMQNGSSIAIIDSNGNFNRDYYPHNGTYCFAGGYGSTRFTIKITSTY